MQPQYTGMPPTAYQAPFMQGSQTQQQTVEYGKPPEGIDYPVPTGS